MELNFYFNEENRLMTVMEFYLMLNDRLKQGWEQSVRLKNFEEKGC